MEKLEIPKLDYKSFQDRDLVSFILVLSAFSRLSDIQ